MTDLSLIVSADSLKQEAKNLNRPVQRVLYEMLRDGINTGKLLGGAMLPSSRTLATELGVARNGVLYAYEQLIAEGYLVADRQGTCVAAWPELRRAGVPQKQKSKFKPTLASRAEPLSRIRSVEDDRQPLVPGMPALDAFPLPLWQRLCTQAMKDGHTNELGYRFNNGEWELRQAIATYLRVARGIKCVAEQVSITEGTQHSMALCAWMLADEGDTAWIEDPGYGGAFAAFYHAGLTIHPVRVDHEGIAPSALEWNKHTPRLIYTTPSHQFPLGSVLSLRRRLQLIEQARLNNIWILEDDYDSEFRHEGSPLCAMQGQAEDAPVVYLGTFSKSMFPALRIGYIVWPPHIAEKAMEVLGEIERRGRPFEQRALAAFINEGYFTQHLRKLRKLYRERRDALFSALDKHWELPTEIWGGEAGMHLTITLEQKGKYAASDSDIVSAAQQQGLFPRALSSAVRGNALIRNGLVLGYANTPAEIMDDSIKKLAKVARQLTPTVSTKNGKR